MSKASTLIDNFQSSNINPGLWSVLGNVTELNALSIVCPYNSTQVNSLTSIADYDLTNSSAFIEVINVGDQSLTSLTVIPLQLNDSTSTFSVYWVIENNNLTCRFFAGSEYIFNAQMVYNPIIHKYLRIRATTTDVYWDYSSDGVTWNNLVDETLSAMGYSSSNITSMTVEMSAYTSSDEVLATSVSFAYLNSLPASLTPVETTHQYKVFNNGIYLGLLPNVTSDFNLNETINTAGAQLPITVGQSPDISSLPISPILDENGNIITDETGSPILPERSQDLVSSNSNNILIQVDNDIEVWEYSKWYPNGVCVYQGYISKWKATFGATNDILITCLSHGNDLNNHVVTASDTESEVSQLTLNSYQNISTYGAVQQVSQTFQIPDASKDIIGIRFGYETFALNEVEVSLYIQAGASPSPNTDTLLNSISLTLPISFATAFVAYFNQKTTLHSGNTYYFMIRAVTTQSPVTIYLSTSNPYASGEMYTSSYSNGVFGAVTGNSSDDLYFAVYAYSGSIVATYTNEDVSSYIMNDVMTNYHYDGGVMQIPTSGYLPSGQLATYTFQMQKLLQAIGTLQQLAPPGWWYYAEPSDSTLQFDAAGTVADFIFIKGRHLDEIDIEATRENIKNVVYFTGGASNPSGSYSGANIFVKVTDATSLSEGKVGLDIISDNRVNYTNLGSDATAISTAQALAQSDIDNNNEETYIVNLTVDNSTIDTIPMKIGQMIGFAGFGNFPDSLVLQIVSRNRTPDYTTFGLGTLPLRSTQLIRDINKNLSYLQTIDNPTTPS